MCQHNSEIEIVEEEGENEDVTKVPRQQKKGVRNKNQVSMPCNSKMECSEHKLPLHFLHLIDIVAMELRRDRGENKVILRFITISIQAAER